ncbi:hypothetical protein MRB53_011128 [Persea americana]|uniref:Uncharacterized protein n=1 Tax=Persea americana TaxID=3435 RepID=A0ACC2LUX6_PERAE|nr:hypothetical protein MRB53_011128 [Persea americana]
MQAKISEALNLANSSVEDHRCRQLDQRGKAVEIGAFLFRRRRRTMKKEAAAAELQPNKSKRPSERERERASARAREPIASLSGENRRIESSPSLKDFVIVQGDNSIWIEWTSMRKSRRLEKGLMGLFTRLLTA